ncbi:hypothetical protein [Spirosoma sp. KNUC1025]|uniref:hypothetical protein n=1 Tax=Spirosoma sp. KNUC1025 TaxID=2894082 RepID=UPI003870BCCF|nr:hypothetical protein LN737_19275 [Spirosoma sp. KNUC1025]
MEKKEETKNQNHYNTLLTYSLSHTEFKGSIFEDDIITQTIRLGLQTLKSKFKLKKKVDRQNVLIIDDFDRLDPEHIFRILNILSVHNNSYNGKNKFGFDKIIIVCSIDNIENIFEHKYGANANFEGYIQKFYSTDIFHFDNQAAIAEYCRNEFTADLDENSLVTLSIILAYWVRNKLISVRSITKHERISKIRPFHFGPFKFDPAIDLIYEGPITVINSRESQGNNMIWDKRYMLPVHKGVESFIINNVDFPFLKVIQILTSIIGDYKRLMVALSRSDNGKELILKEDIPSVIKAMLPISHVLGSIHNPSKLFCEIKSDESINRYQSRHISIFDFPMSTNFGRGISINLGWNKENQYDGKRSYYELVNEKFNQSPDFGVNEISINHILGLIKNISYSLENLNLIGNLGLSH